MSEDNILNKYVCLNPFNYLDIQGNGQFLCCPSWLDVNIRKKPDDPVLPETEDLLANWQSPAAKSVRRSMLNGTYKYCDHKICPSLSQLINTGKQPYNFVTKEEFKKKYNISTPDEAENYEGLPENFLFGFDRACNLKCPSCRYDVVPNDDPNSESYRVKLFLIDSIEKNFSSSAKKMLITGSGDPFFSKIFREYLINFDASKYPNLKHIKLITNGKMLNQKMWETMKAAPYIKQIEISVDAGTKETYEKVTRLNGDWNRLMENLKFISTIKTLDHIVLSMVVSKNNYKEMFTFWELVKGIFEDSMVKTYQVNFRQIVHWSSGAYTYQDIKNLAVFEPVHPLYDDFKKELLKLPVRREVTHNFHHLL